MNKNNGNSNFPSSPGAALTKGLSQSTPVCHNIDILLPIQQIKNRSETRNEKKKKKRGKRKTDNDFYEVFKEKVMIFKYTAEK